MTLLEIVKVFCLRTGLPQPLSVEGTSTAQVGQLLGLVGQVLEDLLKHEWTMLHEEALFTTVAGEAQGELTALAPNGLRSIVNETIFNRTLRLPVYGPIAARKWQALKALPNAGPFYKYRIVGGKLLFNPPAVAGHICAFEYISSYAVIAGDGSRKLYPTQDKDTFVFPASLLIAGLRWMWKSEKGLDYAEDFRRYEEELLNLKGKDGTKPVLMLDGSAAEFRPGIFVPSGNWNLPS